MRVHGLEYQKFLQSNKMLDSVRGSFISHNDIGILKMSGFENYLQEILRFITGTKSYPTLFGDATFVLSPLETNRIHPMIKQ